MATKKPKLGTGQRFANLEHSLTTGKRAKDVYNPAGLAAYIGREKYGNKKFAKLSANGKK